MVCSNPLKQQDDNRNEQATIDDCKSRVETLGDMYNSWFYRTSLLERNQWIHNKGVYIGAWHSFKHNSKMSLKLVRL